MLLVLFQLSGRSSLASSVGLSSSTYPLNGDVPQGSILGPLPLLPLSTHSSRLSLSHSWPELPSQATGFWIYLLNFHPSHPTAFRTSTWKTHRPLTLNTILNWPYDHPCSSFSCHILCPTISQWSRPKAGVIFYPSLSFPVSHLLSSLSISQISILCLYLSSLLVTTISSLMVSCWFLWI